MTEGNDSEWMYALLLDGIQPPLRPVNFAVGEVLLILCEVVETGVEPCASRDVVAWVFIQCTC